MKAKDLNILIENMGRYTNTSYPQVNKCALYVAYSDVSGSLIPSDVDHYSEVSGSEIPNDVDHSQPKI